jgi:hypothetical protein
MVGVEPTQSQDIGFTVRPGSPTPAHAHIKTQSSF